MNQKVSYGKVNNGDNVNVTDGLGMAGVQRWVQAGTLAQQRLARGVRLNMPEACCLLTSQCLEFIRDGKSVADLMDIGRQLLGRRQVRVLRF